MDEESTNDYQSKNSCPAELTEERQSELKKKQTENIIKKIKTLV